MKLAAHQGVLLALVLGAPSLHAQTTVDGFWLGTLNAGGQALRIQVTVKRDAEQKLSCTVDSLDQRAFGLPCANVALAGSDFSFEVTPVNGRYAGKLAADGRRSPAPGVRAPRSP